jgi:glycosyltransferase involved in cell wall biosynthesis
LKFSIVTISFNQARFLEQAIRSVVEQDYPDIEYIVVDPGSTDGSREIIGRYRNRISKIIFEPDNGPADGLNKGFAHATGDVFAYINSDDYFEPYAFSRIAKFFNERQDVDVVLGAIRIVDENGHAKWRKHMSDKFDLKKFAEGRCWFGQQATFFRSATYGKLVIFNVENKTCWDAEFLVDMALNGYRFGRTFNVLGNFRFYADSISGSGRLKYSYNNDIGRINNKINGVISHANSPYVSAMLSILYKFSFRRHLINFFVK